MTLRDESGFTLVELLVVMVISIVVLSATLATFNNLYRSEHENDARLDTVEVARNALDVQARQLRNIAKRLNNTPVMDTVGPYDLIFQTSDPSRTWVRYCLDTTNAPASIDRGRIWTQELAVVSSAALPVTDAMKSGCPGPTASWSTTTVVADYVTNRRTGDRPLFTYTCTTGTACASSLATFDQIVTVGAQTLIDTTPGLGAPELRVASGVYLRNQNQAPVAAFVSTPKAGEARTVVFNASGSSDFEGRTLNYYWFDNVLPALSAVDCSKPTVSFNSDGTVRTLWGSNGFMGESVTLSHTFPAGTGGTSRNIGLVVCDPGDRYGLAGFAPAIPVQIPS